MSVKARYLTSVVLDEDTNDILEFYRSTTPDFSKSKFLNHLIREKKAQDDYDKKELSKAEDEKALKILEVSKHE
jgi:hypothetical protein